MIPEGRAIRSLTDVVAVERHAPGMVRIVTWSDVYTVDARGEGCQCPDKEYNLELGEKCKHHAAAFLATSEYPAPWDVEDDLGARADADPVPVTDGGRDQWTVRDTERDNERHFDSRSDAEDAVDQMRSLGADVELLTPGESGTDESDDNPETDGGSAEVVDVKPVEPDPEPEAADAAAAAELPERSVADDPLQWVPGEFVDTIDGTQAINRKGFEVLSHFYDIDVHADLEVPPEETDFKFCRVKATAVTADGRECEAYGSAHVDRGDDKTLLLEMADTRARKRALSIASGVGAVAVAELKSEVEQ